MRTSPLKEERTSPFKEERTLTEEYKRKLQDTETENPGLKSNCAANYVTRGNSLKSLCFEGQGWDGEGGSG